VPNPEKSKFKEIKDMPPVNLLYMGLFRRIENSSKAPAAA